MNLEALRSIFHREKQQPLFETPDPDKTYGREVEPGHVVYDSPLYNIFEDRDRFRIEAFAQVPGALRGHGIIRMKGPSGIYMIVNLDAGIGEKRIVEVGRIDPTKQAEAASPIAQNQNLT